MANKKNLQTFTFFLIEVLIPLVFIPVLPAVFDNCSDIEAFLIGTCVSIFLHLWMSDSKYDAKYNNILSNTKDIQKKLEEINRILHVMEIYYKLSVLSDNMHPYFKKQIENVLLKSFDDFREKNQKLIDGYLETSPYKEQTFGIEGLQWTKRNLLAVTSIYDYWDRTSFVSDYLKVQYDLIKSKKIAIQRIFIYDKKNKKLEKVMNEQKINGIEVYFIHVDSAYCNKEWLEQDFLIQDNVLLVDLKCKSHKYDDEGKEIITTNRSMVSQKIEMFHKMLESATKLD